jgi:hypothetical protein
MVGTTIVTSTESPTTLMFGTRESAAVADCTANADVTLGYAAAMGTCGDGPTT